MIRAAMTWFPVVVCLGAFLLMMVFSEVINSGVKPEPGTMVYNLSENQWIVLSILAMTGMSFLSIGAGLIVSIISPKKGLVDFLLGTRLMPK